jgi:hypothetical protein
MPKLTDTQLVILSAAARRGDGAALPLPDTLKVRGGAATNVLKSLLKNGLVAEQPAARGVETWRQTGDGEGVTLAITDAGLQAIGVEPDQETKTQAAADQGQDKSRRRPTSREVADPTAKVVRSSTMVRPGTKHALLIDLLRRKDGASIDEIVSATRWQPHSVRGAISGALKKKLGLTVTSVPVEGRGRVYRLC